MTSKSGFTLLELIVAMGIMAVLLGLAAPPFTSWLKKGWLEDQASQLHETFKSAQIQAVKSGEADIINGKIIKQFIYLAVNQTGNSYRVLRWRDENSDSIKDANEFTIISDTSLKNANFGVLAAVDKKACSNNTGAPADSVVNFTATNCPTGLALFTDYRCARFDGKGFFSESMQNASIYITNGTDNFAVEFNPAGVMTLCRWGGTEWNFIR